jgi:hypothetical protein
MGARSAVKQIWSVTRVVKERIRWVDIQYSQGYTMEEEACCEADLEQ